MTYKEELKKDVLMANLSVLFFCLISFYKRSLLGIGILYYTILYTWYRYPIIFNPLRQVLFQRRQVLVKLRTMDNANRKHAHQEKRSYL